ncbi:hypothetical protein EBR03_03730, partial [bacterium]|nr:hypothetical protein [bacterium]
VETAPETLDSSEASGVESTQAQSSTQSEQEPVATSEEQSAESPARLQLRQLKQKRASQAKPLNLRSGVSSLRL